MQMHVYMFLPSTYQLSYRFFFLITHEITGSLDFELQPSRSLFLAAYATT